MKQEQERQSGQHSGQSKRLLLACLALLPALAPLSWAEKLHAETNATRLGHKNNGEESSKLEGGFKNQTFWKSLPENDKKVLKHFGINAASTLYRYAHALQNLLIELGAAIETPLPTEETILARPTQGKTEHSNSLDGVDELSQRLITLAGKSTFSKLNGLCNQLEDSITENLKRAIRDKSVQPAKAKEIALKLLKLMEGINKKESQAVPQIEEKNIDDEIREAKRLGETNNHKQSAIAWENISQQLGKSLGADSAAYARSTVNLAIQYMKQGYYSKAELLLIRALRIVEEALGKDHPDTATTLSALGSLYSDQSHYNKARTLLVRALAIRTEALGKDHPDTATSMHDLATVYVKQGHFREAELLTSKAHLITEKALGSGHPQTANSLNNLGVLYAIKGDFRKAEALTARALAIEKKAFGPYHPNTVASVNLLGRLYRDQGLYSKAEQLLIESYSTAEKKIGANNPATAIYLRDLAGLYAMQGLYGKAEEYFTRALEIQARSVGAGNPEYSYSMAQLAGLYSMQGLYSKAESLYTRAKIAAEETHGSDSVYTTGVTAGLANLYQRQGLYSKAEPLYIRALIITERALGNTHLDNAAILNELGILYGSQRKYSKAEALIKRAIEIQTMHLGSEHPSTASSIESLATIYRDLGIYSKAEQLYIRSEAALEKAIGPEHPGTTEILNSLALLYAKQGLNDRALGSISQSLAQQTTWLSRELPMLNTQTRSSQLAALGNTWQLPFGLTNRDQKAGELALRTRLNRQGLLQEIEQLQTVFVNTNSIDQEKVQQVQSLTQKLASVALPSDQRALIRQQRERLQTELYRHYPDLQIQTVTTEDVAKTLPPDGVLVEFQRYRSYDGRAPVGQPWGKPQYVALILKPNSAVTAVQLGPATAIDATIHQALAASAQDQQDAETLLAQLSQQIFKPLLPELSASRKWFISPDGELNRVPFAALPAPQEPDIPLGEAVQLRLVTTGRELVRLQKANPLTNKAVVLANPSFDRNGNSKSIAEETTTDSNPRRRSADLGSRQWTALPASQQEGQQVAHLLSTQLMSGPAATTAALQHQQGPRVLHIATHGFFVADQESNPADPLHIVQDQAPQLQGLRQEDPQLRSGLVLAGANQPDADPNDDGYLTAAEALLLNLKGTELVVLSACSTGQGDIRTGEGVYGLQRSLTVAGARSTLLSLWKVDDAATAEFMTRFYKRLKAGEGRSDALAATQREFRDGTAGNGQWKEPFYWAAWQLTGDWRPIPGL